MTQRDTAATLAWYDAHQTTAALGFNPDGQCLKICRTARNLPGGWASALVAQNATPREHRITDLSKVRPGMVMYFDDPRDGNQFGHIVTVCAVRPNATTLADINVWTNSVTSGRVVKVSADYFGKHWGDGFQFAATWLNGEALIMPKAPAYSKAPIGDVAAWNTKVGDRENFPAELDAFIGKRVIGLMETGGHRGDIARWATGKGYSIVSGSGEIGASSQLLVQHRSGLIDRGVIRVTTPWRGPKGKRINGRAFPWVILPINGRPTLVLLVHDVWNSAKNWRAKRATALAIRRLAAAHRDVDFLVIGDLNQSPTSRLPYSTLGTTNKIRGSIVSTGASVDYGIYRPARNPAAARPAVVRGRKGGRMGSDHPVVSYSIGA